MERDFFEIGPIRPPSEGGSYSLLIRATRNCPWSRCTFCYGTPYNREKFQLRGVEEIKKDIDAAKRIAQGIKAFSWKLGFGGTIDRYRAPTILRAIVQGNPVIGEEHCFVTVFNWLVSGAKTAFLQDANTLIMRTPELVEVNRYLKETFPALERITSYARAKTAAKKTLEELKSLKEAGLSRLHIGLESGDNEILKEVDKGVTAEEHILAGKKVKEAEIELSEYVMPGLGGKAKWVQHAINTAKVLSEIDPDFIRLRSLVPRPSTPLFDAYQRGEFELTSPHERLWELKLMVESLEISGRLCFDHLVNWQFKHRKGWLFRQDYEGYKFPEQKQRVLDLIETGLEIDESHYVWAKDLISLPHL